MKSLIQYILAAALCVVVFSCSNHFLNEEPDFSTSAIGGVYLSPQWESTDYSVYVPNAGNAKFSVIKTPDWLQVNTSSGQFRDDYALINCSVSARNDFSAMGVYNDVLVLDMEGSGKCVVSVSYISEGNPAIQTDANLTLQYDYYSSNTRTSLSIGNAGDGLLLWQITEKPDWITIHLPSGTPLPDHTTPYPIPQYGGITLDVLYNRDSVPSTNMQGKIVIKSNDKNNSETAVTVIFNSGTPSLYCNFDHLDFGRTETTQTASFYNQGNGLLRWRIDSIPEWLSVSTGSGVLSPYSQQDLTFTCNRGRIPMPNGQLSLTIYLITNDPNYPSYPITVTATNYTANPDNIRAIPGIVTDAWADRAADMLYLTTTQPNRFLAYNMKAKTVDREVDLSKAPICFSVSEDGHKAVIGHGGLISVVDMDHFSLSKTIETDNIINTIEWGSGSWCCYPMDEGGYGSYHLLWRNIDTGELYDSNYSNLNYETILKKVPHQDYIIAAAKYYATVFSTQTRESIQEIYQSFDNLWFSSNGYYVFSPHNQIFRTSSFLSPHDTYASPIGSFSPMPTQTFWIDPNADSHSVWILSQAADSYDISHREILQYEDNDYTFVKKYFYDESYNGNAVRAEYIFANSTGNEVIAVKNAISSYGEQLNDWLIEHIPVTN